MRSKMIIFLLLTVSGFAFAQKRFYKGNTHTHCFLKSIDIFDFSYTASKVVANYKAKGYDFLVFTDHDNYWDASGLSTEDFIVLNGSEIGIYGINRSCHFTALGIQSNILGIGATYQELLDAIVAQGGIAFLNHPRWAGYAHCSAKQVINDMKQNLFHVEVYTAGVDSLTKYDTSLWDSVLTTGRLMYGIASDDSHKESDQGRGWICVYASSLHPDTLIYAIRNGNFYASNGIILEFIEYLPDRITVQSRNGTSIRFIGSGGKTLSTIDDAEATYMIQGGEEYVRAEISNTLNQTAWIQPYIIDTSTTDVERSKWIGLPEANLLYQNYPNPFNQSTTIRFSLLKSLFVSLKIYNFLGKEVNTLISEYRSAGEYEVEWNAEDLPSGIYLYRLETGDYVETRKLILQK